MAAMDDFEQQQLDIMQRRKRAQDGQAYKPVEGQMVSGRYVAPSWTQVLAEGLRGYSDIQDEKKYDQQLKDLRADRKSTMAEVLRNYQTAMTPTPAVASTTTATEMPTFDDTDAASLQGVSGYGATTGAQAAKAPDYRAAGGILAASPFAQHQTAGLNLLGQIPTMEANALDRQENRTLKEQEYKDKIQAKKDADLLRIEEQKRRDQERREDEIRRDRERREDRDNNTRLAASLRQPKPAGEGWKYDAGSDAWVKPPSAEFPMGQTTPNAGKAASLKNFEYLATNMTGEDDKGGTIAKTPQGGYFGLGGALGSGTQAAKEFDNTVEQMSTELRTVFRIPGEGALSDKEQAQYGIQLPKRGNEPDLNRKIIKDLRVRMNNRVNPQGVVPAQTPTGTTPIYASNGTQRIVSNDGGKTWQPAK